MSSQENSSKTAMPIALWTAQILLAILLISGAVMKFLPIEKIAAMMPWTGEAAAWQVRLLGIVDLAGAIGLIVPSVTRICPQLTVWAAAGVVALMLSAIIFHVSRGEASVIGINIISAFLALFVAWGRMSRWRVEAK